MKKYATTGILIVPEGDTLCLITQQSRARLVTMT